MIIPAKDPTQLECFWHHAPPNGAFHHIKFRHRLNLSTLAKCNRQGLGALGESLAQSWAEKSGFKTVVRRFRNQACELDLVVGSRENLRVLEVKTRLNPKRAPDMHQVASWINERKRLALQRGAATLLQKLGQADSCFHSVTFELIAIDICTKDGFISFYRWPNIFS